MRNIDKLNELIKKHVPGLPSFRNHVTESQGNLKFLRKTINPQDVPEELITLLNLNPKQMMLPYGN